MIVNTQELNTMLGKLSRIMPKRSPLPAELCYELWADGGRLYGYAANTGDGIGLRLDIACEGEFPDVVVEGTLGKVLRYLRDETVELSLTEDEWQVICKSGNSVSRHNISGGYMPKIQSGDIKSFGSISSDEFAMIASGVVQLTDKSNPNPLMRAALIRGGFVSATDSFSAARVSCLALDKGLVAFPTAYALGEFARAGVDAEVLASDSSVVFIGENIELRTLQLDVNRALDISSFFMQSSAKFVSEIDAVEFVNALSAASLFVDPHNLAVELDVSPEELIVLAGNYKAALPCRSNVSETLCFDVKRMLQASRAFFKDVEFSFEGAKVLFRGKYEYTMMGMALRSNPGGVAQ